MRILNWMRAPLMLLALFGIWACAPVAVGPRVDVSQTVNVALLVPLGSGDAQREALGQSLVNAARLAETDLVGVKINLRVYAAAGDTAAAAAAAIKAIDEGAQIIVGPLFGAATTAVAPIAAARGIKVLSFTNNSEIAGGNVYILGLTFDNTADRLMSFASSRGLNDVGIVHPQGIEGEQARRAVDSAAARRGMRVRAVGSYPLSVEGITENASAIASQMRSAAVNVLVLTDGPTSGLSYVSETLRGMGLRPDNVQFIGLQRWDTSIQAMGQPGLQGGWFAAPDPARMAQFASHYRANFGSDPHALASLAYDGIAAVGALVRDAQTAGTSDPFSAARLTQASGFAGVNGAFRFLSNGRNERALAILAVENGTAQVIDPAARGFGAGAF